jgi:DNA-binding IclR family transcriptional regulator
VEPQDSNAALKARLAQVRQQGHAVTRGYIHQDSTAVAVPVRGPYDQAVASLAVVVPTEGFQLEPVLGVLAPTARTISVELRKSFAG